MFVRVSQFTVSKQRALYKRNRFETDIPYGTIAQRNFYKPMTSLVYYTCLAGHGLTVSPTSQHVNFLSSEAGMKYKQNEAF